ncbi:histidine phosphatase family protein [Leptospira fluminis]|uniref:Histidine phosphatase family protein n=1 Tax=Leptospira fluminis TaxID=2484979 RepID=A0A4R9GT34_9LEPT|nr:histidine phosphatase family protein [Leptospira fluminis]TGK21193.1 histidine phosphatase family protein [Leptospira fluminis]
MKSIYLIRHSKSDWETSYSRDKERPLSERGRKNAKTLRKYLNKISFSTDLALVSPSERTKETFRILNVPEPLAKNVNFVSSLYEAEGSELLELLRKLEYDLDNVLIVGHNPGLENLAERLIFGKKETFPESLFLKFPTSGFLSLVLNSTDWKDCGAVPCQMQRFWIP